MTYDEEKAARLQRSREYNEGIRQRAEAAESNQRAADIGALSRKVSELESRVDRLNSN